MTGIPTHNSPEKQQVIADNARKFIVENIDVSLLAGEGVTSFKLTTDWLKTGEDDEEKIVRKEFPDGTIQTLHIAKVTVDGNRTAKKQAITPEEYDHLLNSSLVRVEKTRNEFIFKQNGVRFDAKYDEFAGPNSLCVLEIDASNEEARDKFDLAAFPGKLSEVIDDRSYEGYRVASRL